MTEHTAGASPLVPPWSGFHRIALVTGDLDATIRFYTMRTGRTPGGKQLKEDMPWKYYGQMTDEELKTIWSYLQSQPRLEQAQ